MQAYRLIVKAFREEEQTQTVAMSDMDIVKISIVAWNYRNEMDFSKKFIGCSFALSLIVVVIQAVILVGMDLEVTDRLFCGDIVRHIETEAGNPTNFFANDGNDTHAYFKNLWTDTYLKQAQEEIAKERNRTYETRYEPAC